MSANGKTPFLTPQQELFLAYYTNPKSDTFSNAYQSAIKAKYKEDYARNITAELPDWLQENLGDMTRLRKAEKNLDEVQNFNVVDERIKVDMFYAERLGKQKYSARTELTGKDGGAIEFLDKSDDDLAKLAGLKD